MAVEFPVNVYGLTDSGKKVKIGKVYVPAEAVGGTIFYIDDAADGIYEFLDKEGNPLQSVNVGDRPYAYRVIRAGTRDKYYVYHDEMYAPSNWTYYKNGEYVYGTISSIGTEIGKGKTNTNIMMARDNGAYVTADSKGSPTVWYRLQQARNANVGGCNDWFVPSRDEIEELRKAIGFRVVTPANAPIILPAGKVTGGVIAGTADGQAHYVDYGSNNTRTCYPSATKFLDCNIWSSSSVSDQRARAWYYKGQYWADYYRSNSSLSALFVRAF